MKKIIASILLVTVLFSGCNNTNKLGESTESSKKTSPDSSVASKEDSKTEKPAPRTDGPIHVEDYLNNVNAALGKEKELSVLILPKEFEQPDVVIPIDRLHSVLLISYDEKFMVRDMLLIVEKTVPNEEEKKQLDLLAYILAKELDPKAETDYELIQELSAKSLEDRTQTKVGLGENLSYIIDYEMDEQFVFSYFIRPIDEAVEHITENENQTENSAETSK